MAHSVDLTTGSLSIEDVVAVARENVRVRVSPKSIAAMKRSRTVVERALKDGEPHYGINTGFGSLSKQRIGEADLAALQRNLVRSHSAGVGEPLPRDVVRAMMLLLAASLGRGLSGVRPIVCETIVAMLNKGVTPIVPSVGSVGASGDLAPLSAVALVAIGEGEAELGGRRMSGAAALRKARMKPLELSAKEGLALINGTHLMAGWGSLISHDASTLFGAAVIATAISIEACRATDEFLDDRLYRARNCYSMRTVAERMRELLSGSRILPSHVENDPRVQDPYSLRAAPTVLGACWYAMGNLNSVLEYDELGAVTDNPLVFPRPGGRGDILSGANFHGMPLAIPLDLLAIALCHIAGIAERRIYLITGAFEPESHLKPYLSPLPGLQSGLMIAQYTAAACVNEMIGLATPASVANIPTSAGMEDYNSFGPRSAAKAARSLDLARKVVAIELICAAQGLEAHRPLKSGKGVEAAYKIVRSKVKKLTHDRPLTRDIEAVSDLIREGAFGGI
ncbi:MAG: histidine ammonia-lyase [Phycisphaeraceae bacterium]|nr:histidine ammonia-lyase [Phycisphaeraceae bacterium]